MTVKKTTPPKIVHIQIGQIPNGRWAWVMFGPTRRALVGSAMSYKTRQTAEKTALQHFPEVPQYLAAFAEAQVEELQVQPELESAKIEGASDDEQEADD